MAEKLLKTLGLMEHNQMHPYKDNLDHTQEGKKPMERLVMVQPFIIQT